MKFIITLFLVLSAFVLSAQTINITAPNGGEFYNANSAQTITWTTTGSVPPMDLYYTTDNGVNWTQYASGINAASGSYIWTVPNNPSNVCRIRLESGIVSDVSDGVFSINFNNNSLNLTSPNGGQVYSGGSSQTVTWTTSGPIGNLTMYYSIDNGSNWISYASGISPFSGSYSWTVPNVTSTDCLVRLTDGITTTESNSVFTINGVAPGFITVLQPNGGEVMDQGIFYNIQWTTSGTVGPIDISYSIDNGVNWALITTGETGVNYNWLVPNATSTNCLIRLTDGILADESDAVFTINPDPTTITLTAPNGGEVLQGFDDFLITWDTVGNSHIDSVEISFQETSGFAPYFVRVKNIGEYTWQIHNVSTTTAKIRVKLQGFVINDPSDANFSINPIAIDLANPNGGEILAGGDSYQINWSQTGTFSGVDVMVSLDSGMTYTTVANNVVDTFYVWNVPNVDSLYCVVKLDYQGFISDSSDATFRISTNSIELLNPNGGEVLLGGQPYQINWTQSGTISGVDVMVSLDSGLTYSLLASSVVDTFYVWNVPNIDTLNCIVKLDYQGIWIDSSDAVFRISPNSIELANPNGGEILVGGDPYQINWTQSGSISGVDVMVSLDSGLTYSLLASNVVDTFYVWNVPNVDTLNCIVKLDYQGVWTDSSDAVFAIQYVDPGVGVDDLSSSKFSIYPNPSNGIINFAYPNGNAISSSVVSVYSISGKLVRRENVMNNMDLNDLPSGIYSVVIIDNNSDLQGVVRVVINN